MSNTNIYSELIDAYFALIENLSKDNKLKLIEKIHSSANSENNITNSAKSFYGIWKSSKSAEEMINEIRNARTSGRIIEEL